jgi:hypothetical protein
VVFQRLLAGVEERLTLSRDTGGKHRELPGQQGEHGPSQQT